MTSPNPDKQPEPSLRPRLLLFLLSRTGIALGLILLVGLAGGTLWLWTFVQKDLGPLVQKNLVQTLNRPVVLGRVERFSLLGLRFGPTSLPAIPSDPDRATVKAVDVAFDPLQLLFKRTLKLHVTLVQPDAYIQQDRQGRWIRTTVSAEQKPGLIKTQLDTIELNHANVVLLPYPKTGNQGIPFAIAEVNGTVNLLDQKQQLINYELTGQPVNGGSFQIQGESNLIANRSNIQLQGQNLLGADLTRLVKLPFDVKTGRVDGNLTVQLRPQQEQKQPLLFGVAGLRAVTAKFDQLPQPFINTQGSLSFKGTQVGLDNVSTSFGKIPLIANGVLDTQSNFNLIARVPSVTLANTLSTLKVKLPVVATGVFAANLAVRGPILQPTLLGTFASQKPARIDRIDFSTIRSGFAFSTGKDAALTLKDLQVIPTAGGNLTGGGTIQFGAKPGVGLNVVAQNLPGDAIARLYGVSPQIKIGPITAKTQVSGSFANLQTLISWQANQATYPAQGNIIIDGTNTFLFPNTVINLAGGDIRAAGQLSNGRWQISGKAADIKLSSIIAQIPPALQAPLSGAFNFSGATASFNPEKIALQGSARLNVANGTLTASNIQAGEGRWQAQIQANNIALGIRSGSPALQAPLSGRLNLVGSTATFNPETLSLQGSGSLNLAGGTVTASNIQVAAGQWQALGSVADVQLSQLLPQLPTQFQGTLGDSKFNLSGSLTAFNLNNLRGNAQGSLNVAGGTLTAANIQLAEGKWQALGSAAGVQLGRLLPQLPTQFQGTLNDSRFNVSGSLTAFDLKNLRGTAQGSLNIAGGTVTAANIQLAEGKWQALGSAAGVQLSQILPQLPPQVDPTLRESRFDLSGSLAAITPSNIRGTANALLGVGGGTVTATNVQLSDGRWQGSFAADGIKLATLAQLGAISLNTSGLSSSLQGRVSGNLNAAGPLVGFNIADVQASGQLRLLDLAAGGVDFDSVLNGEVSITPGQGVNLQLAGVQDRIELVLSPSYRPVSFLVKRNSAIATGTTQGDLLLVRANNFPIGIFKGLAPLPAAIASQPVSGQLDADVAINLSNYGVEGNLAIAQPTLGTVKGDQFTAQFRYSGGVGTLTQGELTLGPSRYTLTGSITPTANGPQFQGQVKIAQGQVQSILTALQLYDVQDFSRGLRPPTYGRAADITTVPLGVSEASLLTQLRRFSEIQVLLQQQRLARQQANPLPSLADLKGTFDGEISLSGSLKGVAAKFNLQGQNWQLDTYKFNTVIAQGSFDNGILTLLPVRIESDQSLVAFSGQVGGTQQSGQLQIRNFPIELIDNFVKLPVAVTGQLNATATLAGSRQNPRAIGEINLVGGTINQKPVESARTSFSYDNARLNFGSSIFVSGPQPIQITASVPYELPFADSEPDSDQISLNVNVQNEGLGLINLLTDQVAWQSGQGQVQLQVQGTLKQPLATGSATLNNATITAQALPEPLTDVTGTARFERDRIQVEGIQGKFSKGQVEAKGVIPILTSLDPNDPDKGNPLTVSLERLTLNLKGLYQGGASGNVVITGSALNPLIGGEVQLAQGQVLLTQAAQAAGTPTLSGSGASKVRQSSASSGAATKQIAPTVGNRFTGPVPEFNNLQLSLGKAVAVTLPPVLSFQATGSLSINGGLNDIRPQGTIRLQRGDVNLFTTRFVLARSYDQTATFDPNQGLDPNLDIRLTAVVPEVIQQSQVADTPVQSEVRDTSRLASDFGTLQTIRVQARIAGSASELFNHLELTSEPPRSQSEIVALIGGSFVNTLGRGDSTLGLANFAGSALLGNFQGTFTNIGNALGLSELRIFPTVLTSERARARSTSTLGLAAEAGVNISRDLYASVLRVLTASDQPTEFGVTYRINNRLRLRTYTDFTIDTRAEVQYENRF